MIDTTGKHNLSLRGEDNDVHETIENLLVKVSDLHVTDKQNAEEITYPNLSNQTIHDLAPTSLPPSNVIFEKQKRNVAEPLVSDESYESTDTFLTRIIRFRRNYCRIVMQSRNGPCPLIAAVNALSLLDCVKVPCSSLDGRKDVITRSELTDLIGEIIIVPRVPLSQGLLSNYEKKVADVLEILPSLGYGLDVNVKFNDITGFEYTKQIDLFDLLNLRIYHSWKVEGHYVEAVGDQFYTQVSAKATTDEILNDFLCATQTQMTYSGLFDLQDTVPENSVSILFRNNHFHTMLRHNNCLYLLATDIGFIGQNAVWEILDNIDGDSEWVNENFKPLQEGNTEVPYHHSTTNSSLRQSADDISDSSTVLDRELAEKLQREENRQFRKLSSEKPSPKPDESDTWSAIVRKNREKCSLM